MTGSPPRLGRRRLLAGLAGAAAAVAGCTTETDGDAPDERERPTETPTGDGEPGTPGGVDTAAIEEYLSDAGNFDGTVVDETGADEVEVTVGAAGNGGNFAFDPPAVRVDPGTTVVWRWTGKGALHNVVHEDGDFRSQQVGEAGHTFEQTLAEPGLVRYYCTPHRGLGMKGVVVG